MEFADFNPSPGGPNDRMALTEAPRSEAPTRSLPVGACEPAVTFASASSRVARVSVKVLPLAGQAGLASRSLHELCAKTGFEAHRVAAVLASRCNVLGAFASAP